MESKKKNRNIAGIISVIIAVIVVSGLCVALTMVVQRQKSYRNELEGIYQKSYFDTMDSINNVETKLKKLNAMNTSQLQQTTLNDIWRDCETAQANLSQLSNQDGNINSVIKFFNQLGDYCYFLSNKVKEGKLSAEDAERLDKLSEIVAKLRGEFQAVKGSLSEGGNLVGDFGSQLNFIGQILSGVQHSSIEYPELIYDGPFSDGLNDRDAKALDGLEEITQSQADEWVSAHLEGVEIISRGEVSGSIPTYMFGIRYKGEEGSMQITKRGGLLVYYNLFREVTNPQLDEDEAIQKGKEFLEKLGFESIEAVWASNNHSTVYVNYAYVQDGIIVYPDLIKVKIAADDGAVLGIEAQNYIYNHTVRDVDIAVGAEYEIAPRLTLEREEYAVVPTEWNTEILAKEYVCTYGDNTFYIYVDLKTGEEIRVMLVIDDEGRLLI